MLEMLAAPTCRRYAVNFFVVLAARWSEISRGSKRRGVMQETADFWEARVPCQAMLVEETTMELPIVAREALYQRQSPEWQREVLSDKD